MKKIMILFSVILLASSCAWLKTEPKKQIDAELTAEELKRAERDRELAEAESFVEEGIAYYQKEQDSLALDVWQKALKIIPEDAELYNFRGMALHRMGNVKEALHEFESALMINPTYYQAYNNVGYMWFLLNNYNRAEAAYEQALVYKPNYQDALDNKKLLDEVMQGELAKHVFELNESASKSNDYEEQIVGFKKVLELDSTYAKAHNNIAVAYYYVSQPDSALYHLEQAIHFKKNYPEAINNLAYLYKVAQNYEMAIKLFLKALTLKPRYLGALNNLAETYFLNDELKNARRTLNTVLDLYPGDSVAQRWLIKVETKEAE